MSYYLLFILPGMALSMWAAWRTRSAFTKYSKVPVSTGLTGEQAARRMLDQAGIHDVEVVGTRGMLSDHYNPVNKKLALSEGVYGSRSVAAVGVACHEAGHAIQHAKNYGPLWLRSALVPTANIGSRFSFFVILAGMFMQSPNIMLIGVALFAAVVLFQIVTLPVEFDASARAKKLAVQYGIVHSQETEGMNRVLNAAAMTYVAAVVTSVLTLAYYLMIAFGRRD